jgi:superfamily II DNA or RNA helicase
MLWKKLFDYQKAAAEFVLTHEGSCLFFDQGTGKTYVTLGVIDRESRQPGYQALLVVLKTNKLTTWLAKIEELLPHVNVTSDPVAFKKLPHPRIMLLHYEQLTAKLAKRIEKWPWSFVAFDESQRLKQRGSLSSRNARRFRRAARRCVLSGTPIDKSPVDLWAQLRFAEPSIFGDNWQSFFNRYLRPAGFGGYKFKFKAGMQERFLKRAAPVCLRVDRSVLNLKGSKMHIVPITLWGNQAQTYDELERDLTIEVGETGTVTTPLKVTLMGKLSQITGGFLIDDDGEIHKVGKAKERALKRLLPQLKPPVVVFCRYVHEVHMLEALLRGHYLAVKSVYGKIRDTAKKQERSDILTAFQRGDIDALVCQVRTGGVGVDLFEACNAVFYSCTYSYIDFEQAQSRLERYGQEKYVDFYFLMAQNTIDEDQLQALQSKSRINDLVFKRLKAQHAKGTVMAKEEKKTAKPSKADAKDTKATAKAAPAKETKAPKAAEPEFKYGVSDLAKKLGIKEASVRVGLRNKNIKKAGRSYGWNTIAELDEVANKLRGDEKVKKAAEKEKSAAPAKAKKAA